MRIRRAYRFPAASDRCKNGPRIAPGPAAEISAWLLAAQALFHLSADQRAGSSAKDGPHGAIPLGVDRTTGQRAAGRADAPVVVQEFFSLTCGHCANFHNNVWPEVKSKLVEPGVAPKIRSLFF